MSALRKHLIEALLTLAVIGWLSIFLAPLGNNPDGRNDRYASSSAFFAKDSLRKAYVQQTLPRLAHHIAILAGIALTCLWLGRLRMPTTSYLALHSGLWLFALQQIQAFGWPWEIGPPLSLVQAEVLLFALALIGLRYTPRQARQHLSSPLIFPGFIGFTAIGIGWLVDYSANGPLKNAFLGITHFESFALCLIVLTLTAGISPRLLVRITRFLASVDTAVLKVKPATAAIAAALLTLWLAAIVYGASDIKRAAFLAETVRLPAVFLAAWFCYRWLEDEHGTRHFIRRGLLLSIALCALLALTDHGQLLLLSASILFLLAAWLSSRFTQGRIRYLGQLLAFALAYSIVYAYRDFLLELAPAISDTARIRHGALANPFSSQSDFLAVLSWFQRAGERLGLGGPIPWCSYINLAQDSSRCNGVPQQIQSDYVLIALFAVVGWKTGLLLLTACVAWLLLLPAAQPTAHQGVSQQAYKNWLLAIYAAFLVTQTLLSAAGSLGLVTMTGVPIPLLAFGKTGQLSLAFFCGFAINHTAKESS